MVWMHAHSATVVLTTIFDPILLDDYYENFRRFGHLEKTEIIVRS